MTPVLYRSREFGYRSHYELVLVNRMFIRMDLESTAHAEPSRDRHRLGRQRHYMLTYAACTLRGPSGFRDPAGGKRMYQCLV